MHLYLLFAVLLVLPRKLEWEFYWQWKSYCQYKECSFNFRLPPVLSFSTSSSHIGLRGAQKKRWQPSRHACGVSHKRILLVCSSNDNDDRDIDVVSFIINNIMGTIMRASLCRVHMATSKSSSDAVSGLFCSGWWCSPSLASTLAPATAGLILPYYKNAVKESTNQLSTWAPMDCFVFRGFYYLFSRPFSPPPPLSPPRMDLIVGLSTTRSCCFCRSLWPCPRRYSWLNFYSITVIVVLSLCSCWFSLLLLLVMAATTTGQVRWWNGMWFNNVVVTLPRT